MPRYAVRLETPVVYQPDHPKAQRPITELVVNAPTPEAALIHTIRVTTGEIAVREIVEVPTNYGQQPPAVEAPDAVSGVAGA